MSLVRRFWPLALVVLLACLPLLNISIPGVLPGATYTPGTLHLLALVMVMAGLALSYHLLLGVAGLLSFGHALYFGFGAYVLGIIMSKLGLGLLPSALLTLLLGIVLANILGAISLQVTGIPFAMVTLAFAQAGSVVVRRDFFDVTGAEEGLRLATDQVPDMFIGVMNTRNVYWLALAVLVVAFLLVTWVQNSRAGHVAEAVRENELRVRVLGMRPFLVKLAIFVSASAIAILMGMVHLLLNSGAIPHIISAEQTIQLVLMVVIGGVGSKWGAIAGATIYVLLSQRLTVLAQAEWIDSLPAFLHIPLSEPMFILGALFILVVLFMPGGVAGTVRRLTRRRRGGPDDEDEGREILESVDDETAPAAGLR